MDKEMEQLRKEIEGYKGSYEQILKINIEKEQFAQAISNRAIVEHLGIVLGMIDRISKESEGDDEVE